MGFWLENANVVTAANAKWGQEEREMGLLLNGEGAVGDLLE